MHPQKKYYRQRAHSNPIADHCFDYPPSPDQQDWSLIFPHSSSRTTAITEAASTASLPSSGSSEPPRKAIKLTDQTSSPPAATASHDQSSNSNNNAVTATNPENEMKNKIMVHFLDIGCGYGGLLVALSPHFPDKNILGIEIRVKVCDYVQDRIRALRASAAIPPTVRAADDDAAASSSGCSSGPLAAAAAAAHTPAPVTVTGDASIQSADRTKTSATGKETLKHEDSIDGNEEKEEKNGNPADVLSSSRRSSSSYQNIGCIRSNAMKYLPNFFPQGSIEKMFFLFPDPHFKKQKHKWRIISQQLLAEYAFILKIGAKVYIATDVKELFDWMVGHFDQHPLFKEDEEKDSDPVVPLLFDSTEEGKKVTRMGGQKFAAVFVRIRDPFVMTHQTHHRSSLGKRRAFRRRVSSSISSTSGGSHDEGKEEEDETSDS
jgi:tRNA (guanine-N7-)-methyltransferase